MPTASLLPGVFQAKKKNGDIYYRSSITYQNKHISLGSYEDEMQAHQAYQEASSLLRQSPAKTLEQYTGRSPLSFEKWVSLINFRSNGIYFKNPIYLRKTYFEYYYSPKDIYLFDIDDLFYYSEHKLMKRGEHLFVSDFGMQTSILSRYGIQSHAVAGRDYLFNNGNPHDLRYENIRILNPYHGVCRMVRRGQEIFQAKIHIRGNYVIGTYATAEEAAIAYNKAVDLLKKAGSPKNYQPNYIEHLSGKEYAKLYSQISISPKLQDITF